MNYRKANIDDIRCLVVLRKKQLVDEGCYSDTNIDDELERYFSAGITNNTLVVWLALEEDYIIGTAGVCYFQYPPRSLSHDFTLLRQLFMEVLCVKRKKNKKEQEE